MRVILASKSPARLQVLRNAGLDPEVVVSGFDESQIVDPVPTRLAARLAEAKGSTVVPHLVGDFVLFACDTVLEFEGRAHGKPGTEEAAIARWQRMRGHEGLLHTGHHIVVHQGERYSEQTRVGSTMVRFADLSDEEIRAYAATGEPQRVAGAFTIDGLGGAFVTSIEGDPFNVVGISLPLVRQMVIDSGVPWHSLWVDQRS
ncbi:nucleoside triphosphate pyrophosphatase [Tessaracoccus sp. MC1756]|uniref:Maf family protein n=1 Tax=Tessaracoccus sp. MC1756 TaxID=2760311 RepID=UPI00160131E1|nr:Maf family protein [Tessaracoccus sp. MC1756]MBB1509395.1 septum formation inhibitor Maf [Tessaracoccus sp. MC1756]